MAETTMQTASGNVTVLRPSTSASSPLRAWSAADVLVIDELLGQDSQKDLGRVLIVNDEFGALSCAFGASTLTVWGDSILSRAAVDHNRVANGLPALAAEDHIRGNDQPRSAFDIVIIRVPKTLALLEHQLRVIASWAEAPAMVVGAGMVRHIHSSTVEAFERTIGPTTTSRATRKARLIYSTPTGQPAEPAHLDERHFAAPSGRRITELPGTFSAGHLDVGSALLLEILSDVAAPDASAVVADLGCGNGIVATELAGVWREPSFLLLDVSDLAIEAAQRTWAANNLGDRMTATVADGFASTPSRSVDVVVTNPPFHQGHALDAALTDRLLADTARVLRHDGDAYVVAQRHLNVHTRMRQWFNEVNVMSKHPSHVVMHAMGPRH